MSGMFNLTNIFELSSENIQKSKLNSIFMRANIASYVGMTLIWIGYIFVVIGASSR